jgi:hypothetical protein
MKKTERVQKPTVGISTNELTNQFLRRKHSTSYYCDIQKSENV